MESHRVNRRTAVIPEIGEIVLVVVDEKNKRQWRKARVVRYIEGKDGVVRGVILLHKGHHIERPLNLVCSLELKCQMEPQEAQRATTSTESEKESRNRRRAAEDAREKIRQL